MKTQTFDNQEQWLAFRKGKITGSRLGDIIIKRGTGHKKGYYELIAERLAVTEEEFDGYVPNETPMERGTRLQKFAIDRFSKETGKKVDEKLVMWVREDNENIAISPDAVVSDTEAVEAKCLSSASHLEAFLTQSVPSEYVDQGLQYFCVNDLLNTLYVVFYDPRIVVKNYFVLEMHRKDYVEQIAKYLDFQRKTLVEVEADVNKLIGF